ncbi:hypothetical protein [uncultured Alistipes sp.]|jgi:hypothetical protein|uniref:hypothetical protein n=1 Tax=uncultured Alistipes sp. TaxID=538949 RepID=UPI00259AD950|nr:hypothetical protein [uncultured Alistipes sp.]
MKQIASFPLTAMMVAVMLSSCCPCRHLTPGTRDSVRIETAVRTERIIDTAFIEVPVEVIRQTVRDTTSHLETAFATSDARILPDGSLSHSLANKPQKHLVEIENKIIYRDSIIYRERDAAKIIKVARPLTWWQQTQIRGFWALLAILLIVCHKQIAALAKLAIGLF